MAQQPLVVLAFSQHVRDEYLAPADLHRLSQFAAWRWVPALAPPRATGDGDAKDDPQELARLTSALAAADAVVVCDGAPRLAAATMDQAPRLRVIGELEGDRFAPRVDLEAAWQRGIRCLDTTHGSSYPMAEWALGLMLLSLRNAGAHFRNLLAGRPGRGGDDFGYRHGELTGKRVGLIGCGHGGRRLISLLRPFAVDIRVYDPYLSGEMADVLDVLLTSLDYVLTDSDVVVCLAPLTPRTRGLLGRRELELIPSGRVLVNVSRGPIIDPEALAQRLARGDIVAGLDVLGERQERHSMDPEAGILSLPNVFISPHIAGVTLASRTRFFQLMVDDLERVFGGHQPRYELTPRTLANRRGADPLALLCLDPDQPPAAPPPC